MKKESVLSSIGLYFKEVFMGVRSIAQACSTSLPYLLSVKSGDLRKEVTEQYPDPVSARTPDDLAPRARGVLSNDIQVCTGCGDCQKICPTQCISIDSEPGAASNKLWVSEFNIDFSKCVFCGLCVESCEPQSLRHTREYELASQYKPQLVRKFGKGKVTEDQRALWKKQRLQSERETSL